MPSRGGRRVGRAAAAIGALSLAPSAMAGPLAITLGPARACQPLTISWDASKGTAPWTLAIVPFNHVPTTLSLPATYAASATWSYSWPVPAFKDSNMKLAVAVSDASGAVAGVSEFTSITGSGACGAPNESLDFIWFIPETSPRECGAWPVGWKADPGNNGIVDPVAVTLLPEGGVPQTYTADANDRSWDWNVSYPRGTRFTLVLSDKGKSGTGGVGVEYAVAAARRGANCNAANVANAGLRDGLMAPTSTVARAAATAAASGMATSRGAARPTSAATPKGTGASGASEDAATDESGKSHTGAIVGAIFGVLAALAFVGGVFWFLRRKRGQDETERPFERQFVSPWRYSVDGAQPGQSRSGGGGGGGVGAMFAALGAKARSAASRRNDYSQDAGSMRSGNDMASLVQNSNVSYPFQGGHNQRDSVSSAVAGGGAGMAGAGAGAGAMHRRRESALGGAPPSTRTARSARSIHSTVPDGALFPPPPPTSNGYRTVPDDTLFPPPSGARGPSPNVGTPLGGVGAGVGAGTYQALNRGASGEIVVAGDYFAHANANATQVHAQAQAQAQAQADSARQTSKSRGARTSELDLLERTLQRERQASRATAHTHHPSEGGSISVERDVAQLQRARQDQRTRDTEDPIATRYIPGGKTSVHDPYAHVSQLFDNEDIAARINGYAPKGREEAPPVPELPKQHAQPQASAPAPAPVQQQQQQHYQQQSAAPSSASTQPTLAPAPSARDEWHSASQQYDARIQSEIMPAMLVGTPRSAQASGGGGGATSPFADPPKGFAAQQQQQKRFQQQQQQQQQQRYSEDSEEEGGLAYL